jgi:hypothetical protein
VVLGVQPPWLPIKMISLLMLCSFAGRAITIRGRPCWLFCRLDYDAKDRPKPLLVVICGLDKPSAKQALGLHEFQGLGPSSRRSCATPGRLNVQSTPLNLWSSYERAAGVQL